MCALGKFSPKMVQWLLEAGADGTRLFPVDDDILVTPFDAINKLVVWEEVDENKQKLEAMRRKLLQARALQSVSWAWGQHAAAFTRRKMCIAMPVVRRGRRETSRVVVGVLMR